MLIIHRIFLTVCSVLAVAAVLVFITLTSVETLTSRIEIATTNPLTQVDAARGAWDAFRDASSELTATLEATRFRSSEESSSRFNGLAQRVGAEIARLRIAQPSARMTDGINSSTKLIDEWQHDAFTLLGLSAATSIPAPHVMEKLETSIRGGLQEIVAIAESDAKQNRDDIKRYAAQTTQTIIAFSMLALTVGLMLAILVAISLARPMVRLQRRMQDLMDGDFASDVCDQQRSDEIGRMAKTVDFVKVKLLQRDQLEKNSIQVQIESERSRDEALKNERAIVSNSIGAGLARLASKDLTFRLTADLPVAYHKLQQDFNDALQQIMAAMQGVHSNSNAIHTSAEEIATASDDLSRRTESQAASLEQTAAATEEITATVKKTAESALHARTVVGTTKVEAELGGEIVQKTVDAMNGIERASKQISQTIGVIDEIAFQTNLLALNAGVEAARAGEAGRGFAVVASEVRALAERSAVAAKQIKDLIFTSTSQVDQGVVLVGETGKALVRIVAGVTEINTIVTDIAASAKEQAIGLAQVNAAVSQMDQVTQQNAAMVEQATAASRTLAHQSDELTSLVGDFKVGSLGSPQDRGRSLSTVTAHPSATKPRAPAQGLVEVSRPARSVTKAIINGSRGSALAKAGPGPGASWAKS